VRLLLTDAKFSWLNLNCQILFLIKKCQNVNQNDIWQFVVNYTLFFYYKFHFWQRTVKIIFFLIFVIFWQTTTLTDDTHMPDENWQMIDKRWQFWQMTLRTVDGCELTDDIKFRQISHLNDIWQFVVNYTLYTLINVIFDS